MISHSDSPFSSRRFLYANLPAAVADQGGQFNPLPRGPVFSWTSLIGHPHPELSSVEDARHQQLTTSGRAAIYQALRQMNLARGDIVMVPTYHCPTMVAPVLLAGGKVEYFGITAQGLPDLENIPLALAKRAVAILVPHYFGLPKSLTNVRSWCDLHEVTLIEDCAHSLFGTAGERPVGAWGDFATASLSKFLPVPEGGLLVSNSGPLAQCKLQSQSLGKQFKGLLDVLHVSTQYQRLGGLNTLIGGLFKFKHFIKRGSAPKSANEKASELDGIADFLAECDMGRISFRPLLISKVINRILPRSRIIARRRDNYNSYTRMLAAYSSPSSPSSLNADLPAASAPYVFPFWVDDADRVYHSLRLAGYPVFRWDRIWPGTTELTGDNGPLWSHHILQLLCHQDLSESDIQKTASALIRLLEERPERGLPSSQEY